MTKLLFISHDANRSGAPLLLLSLLAWLKREGSIAFDVLLLRDGPLRPEFEALGTTFLASEIDGRKSLVSRIVRRWRWRSDAYWRGRAVDRLQRTRYAAVYGNTIVSLAWLVEFQRRGQDRCICHLHEMAWAIGQFFPAAYVSEHLPTMSAVIACAQAVADDLAQRFDVPADKVTLAYSFVAGAIVIDEPRPSVRERLGIGPEAFVIGGVGTPELRKGTDLIVRLAVLLEERGRLPDFRIVWLGGQASSEMVSLLRRDAERLGVSHRLLFIEHSAAPNDTIDAFDALIVPSREEPFTLVALQAASLAKPIVGFSGSGGIAELVRDGCGRTVPYLDLPAMAGVLEDWHANPDAGQRCGENAKRRVAERYTADIVCRQLHALLQGLLADVPGRPNR